ncbi:hypothetical protein LSAT2_012642 [Lamellibrachia satsuma]|nr:hypothetical protein LSAT2_012642 [Lamellibrachia satsuma]
MPGLNNENLIPSAQKAKEEGIEIFVVGVGSEIDFSEIEAIATAPDFVYRVINFDVLNGITQEIVSLNNCFSKVWSSCSESCGVEGVEFCTRHCKEYGISSNTVIKEYDESCGNGTCVIPCMTTSTEPTTEPTTDSADECFLCDMTNGQIWLPDHENCHMFYVCERIGYRKFRKHHMTCDDLWWQQDIHTCVRSPPEGCDVTVDTVPYAAPSTTEAPCPYEPVPNQAGYFRSIDSPDEIQQCIQGMVFQDPPCDCVQVGEIIPTCSDDLLLYFPYEDHYNDVTCHHAIATQYGSNVDILPDADRNSNVACFSGDTHFEVSFLRTWFANKNVDKFSIAVWFQRHGDLSPKAAIVSNANCHESAGYSLGCKNSEITASITTNAEVVLNPQPMADNLWHHAAWVYDGQHLNLYIDGVLSSQTPVSGFMQNNDVPMKIANCCGTSGFIGCMDELRVYERLLTPQDIAELMA